MGITDLPAELMLMVLENTKDPRTTLNLANTIPMAGNIFEAYRHLPKIDHGFIGMNQEIRKIASACAIAEMEKPATFGLNRFRSFVERQVLVDESLRTGFESLSAVELSLLVPYHEAVETIIPYFHSQVPKSTQVNSLRPSETHRIRRALWRYQLYCILFFQPGGTADTKEEALMPEQYAFLSSFEPSELEELETVFDFLYTDILLAQGITSFNTYRMSLGLLFLVGLPTGLPELPQSIAYVRTLKSPPKCYTNDYFLPKAFDLLRRKHDSSPTYHIRLITAKHTVDGNIVYHGAHTRAALWKDIPTWWQCPNEGWKVAYPTGVPNHRRRLDHRVWRRKMWVLWDQVRLSMAEAAGEYIPMKFHGSFQITYKHAAGCRA
ncbi:MAG: hypothetical protein MMC33_006258 [Icmadophila ericetorum]|nr:hypothetical protein [Icmadophila ericetorum]